jgi:4-diphosphocytidyl-2-C-methyl-D-erythritol kinase
MILRPEGEGLRIHAPAKLNLFLDVLGRREDGYHEIATVMTPVDLYDEILLERRESGIELTCDASWVPSGEENLAWRAADLALGRHDLPGGVSIRLTKRIPAGAGLGGGSSDAAAVLAGVPRLFGRSPSPADLQEDAASLGSDVPFFLHGTSAVCRGRGEIVEPLDGCRTCHYVLVVPGLHVATRAVYESIRLKLTPENARRKIIPGLLMGEDCRVAERAWFNGLEAAAFRRYPELRALHGEVERASGRVVRMTGSGSGFFMAAATRKEAVARGSALENQLGWGRAYALTTAHGECSY